MLTGVVLAGGHTASFNGNKAGAVLEGIPVVQYVLDALASVVDDIVITTGPDQPLPDVRCELPVVVCEDLLPERGPLTGILTGLQCARSEYTVVVPCDTPFVEPTLLRSLIALRHGYDAVVPVVGGRPRPLPAVYRKTCIPALERALNGDDLSVTSFLLHVRPCVLEEHRVRETDPELRSFVNINRPRDAAKARRALAPR